MCIDFVVTKENIAYVVMFCYETAYVNLAVFGT